MELGDHLNRADQVRVEVGEVVVRDPVLLVQPAAALGLASKVVASQSGFFVAKMQAVAAPRQD